MPYPASSKPPAKYADPSKINISASAAYSSRRTRFFANVCAEETHLSEILPDLCEQRDRRRTVAPFVELLYLVPQVANGHEIDARWMPQREVHALHYVRLAHTAFGKQLEGDLKRPCDLGPEPGLRLAFAALPTDDRGALDSHALSKLLLTVANGLAAGCEPLPLGRHTEPP